MLEGHYNRFDPNKDFEDHIFRAGYVLQSAELNEIQSASKYRLRGVADAIFKDGDIIRDAEIIVDQHTGETQCASGAVYLSGMVRGVAPKQMTIPTAGTIAVGIRLVSSIVTELDDPDLRDPASLTRNYMEAGAARQKVSTEWGFQGDGLEGEFYPIYTVENGIVHSKEPPPTLDSITHAIATYDRDNSGGNYVVNGYWVEPAAGPDNETDAFVVSAGRARVQGYAVTINHDSRLLRPREPHIRTVLSEPHLADGSSPQRINLDRAPVKTVTSVQVTRDKTVTVTRGMVASGSDSLPDTSILQLIDVRQGGTEYSVGEDVRLTAGQVDWSLAGDEPAGGSTYSVTYRYIVTETPGTFDEDGLEVSDAVDGSLILVTYEAMLPRIDRICLNRDGQFVWAVGISDDYTPGIPSAPAGTLPIARVLHSWRDGVAPVVINDSVRAMSMDELQQINSRIDGIADILARTQLASAADMREAVLKKGLLVDPFIDNTVRDAGVEQDAAIANGILTLPIETEVEYLADGSDAPNTLERTGFTSVLAQEARTGGMKINPYMAFPATPADVEIEPSSDYWAETRVRNTSSVDYQEIVNRSARTAIIGSTYLWGLLGYNTFSGHGAVPSVTTTSTSQTSINNYKVGDIEHLRQLEIVLTATGFEPEETVDELRFDGIEVDPQDI